MCTISCICMVHLSASLNTSLSRVSMNAQWQEIMVDWAKLVVTATELDGMFNMLSSGCCSIRGSKPSLVTLSNVGFEPTSSGVLVVCCLLVFVYCFLFVGCCFLFVGCCLLSVGCWLLDLGCWLLDTISLMLCIVCYVLILVVSAQCLVSVWYLKTNRSVFNGKYYITMVDMSYTQLYKLGILT